jgi:predicted PurR-regulated permease PerM
MRLAGRVLHRIGPVTLNLPQSDGIDPSAAATPFPRGRNRALTVLAVAASILLLRYMQDVLMPMVLAALVFYALDPFVDRFQRWHIPRSIGAALVLLVLIGTIAGLGYSLSDNITEVAHDLPAAAEKIRAQVRESRRDPPSALEQAANAIDKTAEEAAGANAAPPGVVRVQVDAPPFRLTDYLRWSNAGTLAAVSGVAVVLFLTYFLLVSDDLFKRKLVEVIGPLSHKKVTVQVLNQVASQIESFLLIQIFTSVAVGVATWLALWALGLHNAAVWGLCAGIFNSVPYVGPMIVTASLAAIGYIQFGTPAMALTVAGVAWVITSLEGWLLTPLLMSRVAQMNTVAILASLMFWSWMWGIVGLLLAVPIMMAIKSVCDRVEGLEAIGTFLGD